MNQISDALMYWTVIAGMLVLCIFGIFRMLRSYERRNRFQVWFVSLFLGGIVLLILFTNELLPGSKMYYDYEYTQRITGRSMLVDNVFTHEAYFHDITGDGSALYLYKFDEESAKYFRKPNQSFFTSYPYPYKKSGWLRKNWTKTPIAEADSNFRKFVLSEYSDYGARQITELDKVRAVVKELLNEEGNYYAYHASGNGFPIWDISFFVLSPKDGWLVAIYSNM